MKSKLFTLLIVLNFFSTKAQDESNCGILIDGAIVDSIPCWGFKSLWAVFPIKSEWEKYDVIDVGIVYKEASRDIDLRDFYYRKYIQQEFIDNFSNAELGVVRLMGKNVDSHQKYPLINYWGHTANTALFSSSNPDKKSDKSPHRKYSFYMQVRGRTIVGYRSQYEGGGPITNEGIILYKSKEIPIVTYAFKQNRNSEWVLHNPTEQVFIDGPCVSAQKQFPYKTEVVNYTEDVAVVKKKASTEIKNVENPNQNTAVKTNSTNTSSPVKKTPVASVSSLKPLDKTKLGYFVEKDGTAIAQEGYKIGGKLNGEVRTYTEGKVREISMYVNDEKNGLSTSYYANGKVELRGNMKNGEKDGEWKEYDEDGNLISAKKYLNGEVQD